MRWCVWLALAGCNQIFGLEPTEFNAALDDAGPDAPGCSGSLFVNPELLPGSIWGSGTDYDPSASDDPSELWYTHDATETHIRIATRGGTGSYDSFTLFSGNSTSVDQDSNMSKDGLVAVFISDRAIFSYMVYETTRPTRSEPFGSPINIAPQVSSPNEGIDLSSDGLRLYFSDGSLRMVSRTSAGVQFGAPSEVLQTNCHWPTVSPDELELFCERYDAAKNDLGIFRWVRTKTTDPWPATTGEPILVGDTYYDPDVSPDSKRLYFSTGGSLGMMTRTCN